MGDEKNVENIELSNRGGEDAAAAAEDIRASVLSNSEEKVDIVFQDLSYAITLKAKGGDQKNKQPVTKTILSGVTGMFRPGRFTAIMGNSGAGKTSLLNLLAGNLTADGKITMGGSLELNGTRVQPDFMKKVSGFVFQDDLILSTMTVREAISMSAILRLPETMPLEEKMSRVDDIIRILRLEKAANTIVGNDLVKGISGGERKRTSMAMEMVINPSILFLDEPTSGLDTFTAYSVVTTLKDLASQGRTVVATIHQPSSDIFMLFDDLLLLSEGRVVYYGEAKDAVSYFARAGYECPQYMNPSDYIFMHILNNSDEVQVRQGSKEAKENSKNDTLEQMRKIIDLWPTTEEFKKMQVDMGSIKQSDLSARKLKAHTSFGLQFKYLAGRAFRNALRNKMVIFARIMQSIFLGVLMGLIYFDIPSKPLNDGFQNRLGLLFFLVFNSFMSTVTAVLTVFGGEKVIFIREIGAGYYRLEAYYFSKLFVELPMGTLAPIILVVSNYFLAGLQSNATSFFRLMGTSIILSNAATGLGIFITSLFQNLPAALAVVPIILLPFMLFCGYLINYDSIPGYFWWIQWINPLKYAFTAMVKNEFLQPSGEPVLFSNCNFTDPDPRYKQQCLGSGLLELVDMDNQLDYSGNMWVLFAFFLCFIFLAYVTLYRMAPKNVI